MPAPLVAMGAKFAARKVGGTVLRRGATMAAKRAGRSMVRQGAQTAMRQGMQYARSPQGQAQLRQVGQQMMSPQQQMYQPQPQQGPMCPQGCVPAQMVQSYAKGGVVRGNKKGKKVKVLLHKGEKVVAQRNNNKATKAMKKAGMKTRNSGRGAKSMVPKVPMNRLRNLAKGGSVFRTGLYVLRVGQRVVPKNKVNSFNKAMKRV